MAILKIYKTLQAIALNEFSDIVVSSQIITLSTGDPLKLRLDIVDDSLLDIFISISGRYSYHWERRLIDEGGDIYRHDNAPHEKWGQVTTFPKHFHKGSTQNVVESHLSDVPQKAIREFLAFVRQKLISA